MQRVKAVQLWMVLAKCHRAMTQLIEHRAAASGLCLSDFMVLEALLHKGPLTITEIQAKVLLATGSMTVAVDRVEKKGLVVRKTTTADRRARILELTPQGRAVAETAFAQHEKDLESLLSVLTPAERQQIYQPLRTLGLAAAETLSQLKTKE